MGRPQDLPAREYSPEDLAGKLLAAAGGSVTGMDIDELGPNVLAARIGVAGPAGSKQVTAPAGSALALAAALEVPVRVSDALMDRLAIPITGDDLRKPFVDRTPACPPGPRGGPLNLAFADGLDGWIIRGRSLAEVTGAHWNDYAVTAADGTAALSAAVPQPYGDISLGQEWLADDYHGDTVTLRAEVRSQDVSGRAELSLDIASQPQSHGQFQNHGQSQNHGQDREIHPPPGDQPRPVQRVHRDRQHLSETITGTRDWTRYQITGRVPDDAEHMGFEITLVGPGRVQLRKRGTGPHQLTEEAPAGPQRRVMMIAGLPFQCRRRATGRQLQRLRAVLVAGAASVLAVVCVSGCSRGSDNRLSSGSTAGHATAGTVPLAVLTRDTNGGTGDIFIAPAGGGYPAGPEIVTTAGKVVWFHRLPAGDVATDFRTQTYLGQPVLTWFQSRGPEGSTGPAGATSENGPSGPGGTDYIYNGHYQQIAAIRAGNGDATNFHEFLITPWNTALILASTVTTANLTSIGGPADQRVIDGLVQEIDVRTGRVLFQWDSAANVPYADSYQPLPSSRALPGTGFTSTPSTSTPTATCW